MRFKKDITKWGKVHLKAGEVWNVEPFRVDSLRQWMRHKSPKTLVRLVRDTFRVKFWSSPIYVTYKVIVNTWFNGIYRSIYENEEIFEDEKS